MLVNDTQSTLVAPHRKADRLPNALRAKQGRKTALQEKCLQISIDYLTQEKRRLTLDKLSPDFVIPSFTDLRDPNVYIYQTRGVQEPYAFVDVNQTVVLPRNSNLSLYSTRATCCALTNMRLLDTRNNREMILFSHTDPLNYHEDLQRMVTLKDKTEYLIGELKERGFVPLEVNSFPSAASIDHEAAEGLLRQWISPYGIQLNSQCRKGDLPVMGVVDHLGWHVKTLVQNEGFEHGGLWKS